MKTGATAVVLLNWNGWRDTISCLESVLRLTSQSPIAVLVCDNASSDDSLFRLRAWAKDRFRDCPEQWLEIEGPDMEHGSSLLGRVVWVQTGRNGGFAAGNNVGLRLGLAHAFEYFWILNNDTEVDPLALDALTKRMAEDPRIGICGAKLIYAGERGRVQAWGGARFLALKGRSIPLGAFADASAKEDAAEVESALHYVIGASMFVRRSFLETVGLMTEDYFLYWEEIDWAYRAHGRFRLAYAPDAVVYHKVGGSIGTNDFGTSSPLTDYYWARGRLKFCLRHSWISVPFALADTLRDIVRWTSRKNLFRASTIMRALLGMPFRAPDVR